LQALHQTDVSNQNRLLVYNINKHTAIHFIKGTEAVLLADEALLENKDKVKFHLQQHSWKSGIEQQQQVYTDSAWKQISLPNYTCLISGNGLPPTDDSLIDLLLIKNKVDIKSLIQHVKPAKVIITSAVKPYQANKIKEQFSMHNIPVSYAGETGAIEIQLP
jgi:uncharacterized protein YvpB